METWRIAGWIFLCLSLCNAAVAQLAVTDVSVSPQEIWYNQNPNLVVISAKCQYGGSIVDGEMWSQVFFPHSGGITTGPIDTGIYEYQLYTSFPDSGIYSVRVYCSYNGQTVSGSKTFTVHKLDLSLDYTAELDTYLGDDLTLKTQFKRDGSLVSPKKDTFQVYLGLNDRWELLEQTEDPILDGNYQYVKLKIPLYSGKIDTGLYDLRVEASFSDDELVSVEKKKFVWVNHPLEMYLLDNEVFHVIGSPAQQNISAKVVFKAGDLWDLGLENALARVYNDNVSKQVSLKNLDCDRSTQICIFSLDMPSLGPGSYDLELFLGYPSAANYRYDATESLLFHEVLGISGNVLDAKDKVVATKITVENSETGEITEVETSSSGNYSLSLLPGKYNFVFSFAGGIVVKTSDVSISNSDMISLPGEFVRYDSGHMNSSVPDGMRFLKIMVFEFVFPFSDLWVYMPYDSSKLSGDEKKLKVYVCERWNFERSMCTGSWEGVEEVGVHTIKDALEFNASSYGAFMVGESDRLSFSDFAILDDEVFMADMVSVEGFIVNSRKEPVSGASVKAFFPKYGEEATVKTNAEGEFKLSVRAPYVEGEEEMVVVASKDLFIQSNKSSIISISKKKDISILNVPDIIDAPLNEETEIEFKLFNSGQLGLEDTIYLHISGISTDWYELLPNYVDGLDPGDEKPFILRIKMTPELCGGKCNKYYLVNLEAKSQEISKTASFTLKLPQQLVANETEEETEEEVEGGAGITGFSIALPSLSSPYIPLTVIVLLMLLIVNKKKTGGPSKGFGKQGKTGHSVRDSTMSFFQRIKKEL